MTGNPNAATWMGNSNPETRAKGVFTLLGRRIAKRKTYVSESLLLIGRAEGDSDPFVRFAAMSQLKRLLLGASLSESMERRAIGAILSGLGNEQTIPIPERFQKRGNGSGVSFSGITSLSSVDGVARDYCLVLTDKVVEVIAASLKGGEQMAEDSLLHLPEPVIQDLVTIDALDHVVLAKLSTHENAKIAYPAGQRIVAIVHDLTALKFLDLEDDKHRRRFELEAGPAIKKLREIYDVLNDAGDDYAKFSWDVGSLREILERRLYTLTQDRGTARRRARSREPRPRGKIRH